MQTRIDTPESLNYKANMIAELYRKLLSNMFKLPLIRT